MTNKKEVHRKMHFFYLLCSGGNFDLNFHLLNAVVGGLLDGDGQTFVLEGCTLIGDAFQLLHDPAGDGGAFDYEPQK